MRFQQRTDDCAFLRPGRKTEGDMAILEEGDISIWG